MQDEIHINSLKVECHIGCGAEERSSLQVLEIDICLRTNTLKAAKTRNVEDSICWATLSDRIINFVQSKEWILVEELINDLSFLIFESYSTVDSLVSTVRKYPPLAVKSVGVRIERTR